VDAAVLDNLSCFGDLQELAWRDGGSAHSLGAVDFMEQPFIKIKFHDQPLSNRFSRKLSRARPLKVREKQERRRT